MVDFSPSQSNTSFSGCKCSAAWPGTLESLVCRAETEKGSGKHQTPSLSIGGSVEDRTRDPLHDNLQFRKHFHSTQPRPGNCSLLFGLLLGQLGLFIGFRGGWVDEVISRFVDAFLAMPALLVALVVLGVVRNVEAPPGSIQAALQDSSVLLVIGLVYVPIVTRVVRSGTLDVKTRAFVQAAQIRGESSLYTIFREILPSVTPALVVEASLRFSYAIFLVASLGFLGAGARPPSPDWGLMVNENRRIYAVAPWAVSYPAATIALLVIGVNLMSDGIKRLVQKGG